MVYCFDIDGTICSERGDNRFDLAQPNEEVVSEINRLYGLGHKIIIFTSRHLHGKHKTLTKRQLKNWQVKYHELIYDKKPHYDLFVDSKSLNSFSWREELRGVKKKVGFIASCFDLLHCGHCLMLEDAKRHCDHLVVALQTDPTIDRPEKNKPIQSLAERRRVLGSIRYVDEIHIYDTEDSLRTLLKKIMPDVRILGSDYVGKEYTGQGLAHSVHYHRRNHNFSTSELRERIKNA